MPLAREPRIYETWDLEALQNIAAVYAGNSISIPTMKRLARFLNYKLYDSEDGRESINKMIIGIKKMSDGQKPEEFDMEKEIREIGGALAYINPVIVADMLNAKGCVVNRLTLRSCIWRLISVIPSVIDKFIHDGGLNATKDYWLDGRKRSRRRNANNDVRGQVHKRR